GGMLFGRLLKPHHEELLESAEGIGDTFALLTWVLFGAAVVGQAVGNFSWSPVLYAVLSLTVIRMLPVFVCLTGLRGGPEGKLFVGWFGPRGLASIVFAVIVINANVPSADTISAVVTWTVLLSVIAHGVSANPWAKSFGARSQHLDGPEPDGGEASDARDS
ncbi:MAG: cation:proton antiporter domain-containing protein, partial [Planctomycetota bacterium]